MRSRPLPLFFLCSTVLLSGCDYLGIESASDVRARRSAESHAVGAACRQAGTGLQVCMNDSPRSVKAALLEGWKSMDEYMRDNEVAEAPVGVAPENTSNARRLGRAAEAGPGSLSSAHTAPSTPSTPSVPSSSSSASFSSTEDEHRALAEKHAKETVRPAEVPRALRELAHKRYFERGGKPAAERNAR